MGLSIDQFLKQKELEMNNKAKTDNAAIGRIVIDGNDLSGYVKYQFIMRKEYVRSPVRSLSGQIENLDSYASFLTPTIKIFFNAMSIETYRLIQQLIRSKNEFIVEYVDPVVVTDSYPNGVIKKSKMYFAPDDYPEFFIYDLKTLAVMNYSIELIATNSDVETYIVTFDYNLPAEILPYWKKKDDSGALTIDAEKEAKVKFPRNLNGTIGAYNTVYYVNMYIDKDGHALLPDNNVPDTERKKVTYTGSVKDLPTPFKDSYQLAYWYRADKDPTAQDTVHYVDGFAYYFDEPVTLKAHWIKLK